MKTHILLVLCGMVLLASPVWADVTADFTDGNDDETYVDAFHGIPGDGWTTPWEENVGVHGSAGGNEIVTNTVTDTNPIFEAGNKYLSSTVDANGELDVRFAAARNHGGIGRYTPRTIEFTFRLDEDVDGEGSTFTVYQDRYMIFDSYAARP